MFCFFIVYFLAHVIVVCLEKPCSYLHSNRNFCLIRK